MNKGRQLALHIVIGLALTGSQALCADMMHLLRQHQPRLEALRKSLESRSSALMAYHESGLLESTDMEMVSQGRSSLSDCHQALNVTMVAVLLCAHAQKGGTSKSSMTGMIAFTRQITLGARGKVQTTITFLQKSAVLVSNPAVASSILALVKDAEQLDELLSSISSSLLPTLLHASTDSKLQLEPTGIE